MSTEIEQLDQMPLPWYWDGTDWSQQLKNEMPPGHILENKNIKSLARRQDRDDILFKIENDEYEYAVVHLTHAKTQVSNKWPITKLYKNWADLFKNRILKDSEDWED